MRRTALEGVNKESSRNASIGPLSTFSKRRQLPRSLLVVVTIGLLFFSISLYFLYSVSHNDTKEAVVQSVMDIEQEKTEKPAPTEVEEINSQVVKEIKSQQTPEPIPFMSRRLHAFYYAWYGSLEINSEWIHWNHEVLPDWRTPPRAPIRDDIPKALERYHPPEQIGSTYYPEIGPYSSIDDKVIRSHLAQLQKAGVGVISVGWFPESQNDGQIMSSTSFTNRCLERILDIALEFGVYVCLHLEPYNGRSGASHIDDIKYVIDHYGSHKAFYRDQSLGNRPIFYAYDSYQVLASQWAPFLKNDSPTTIRGTAYDSVVLGLILDQSSYVHILQSGFDGCYSYFAATEFTWGSTPKNWQSLSDWANNNGIFFIPSIGPGYDDTRIRPWNFENTRDRRSGEYYQEYFRYAAAVAPRFISITSFNEWHEGTQIENAIPKKSYPDYAPNGPDYYLQLTKKIAETYF